MGGKWGVIGMDFLVGVMKSGLELTVVVMIIHLYDDTTSY